MNGVRFFLTGGAVRDRFLGLTSKDVDFSVEAPSWEAMLAALDARGVRAFQTRPEFLTVRGLDPVHGPADFVMCRKDGTYTDGRRPDAVTPGTLLDDLGRRDFTVNAMAVAEDGSLVDPFGGAADCGARVLRCVGKTSDRFGEDALRPLRAVRFAVTKGFTLHADVTAWLAEPANAATVSTVAVERVKDELHKAFACDTLATLRMLETFPALRDAVFAGMPRLWLAPTLASR